MREKISRVSSSIEMKNLSTIQPSHDLEEIRLEFSQKDMFNKE